tara:strand:- start:79 stop:1383 length:1305 start_codon:yes stop_codon:yes gene_type:complete
MADSPRQAEAAQALFCALADFVGKKKIHSVLDLKTYPSYGLFKKVHSDLITKAHKQLDTPSVSLQDMEKFLVDKKDWYKSSVLTAIKIITSLSSIDKDFNKLSRPGWQNIFYVRGAKADKSRAANAMENVEALFKIANKNNNQFGDVNKWSPADIYFVSGYADKMIDEEVDSLSAKAKNGSGTISDSYDFVDLNELVNGLLDSGDLLPLSLKKVQMVATLHNYNFDRKVEEKKLAQVQYYGISNWSKKYTIAQPVTRDIKIYFSKNQKEKIKIRHDPHSDTFNVNKAVKCEIEVTGAGGRGGSVVGIPRIAQIIGRVDKKLEMQLIREFNRALLNYDKALVQLNNQYSVKKGENKSKLKNIPKKGMQLYKEYTAERAHLSGLYISNAIMPILYDWFTANESDRKTRKLNSKVLQKFIEYTSSRSPQSGKFVIAK